MYTDDFLDFKITFGDITTVNPILLLNVREGAKEGIVEIPVLIKARRHKKKRINKKWIKKYGENPILTFKKVLAKTFTTTPDDYFEEIAIRTKML